MNSLDQLQEAALEIPDSCVFSSDIASALSIFRTDFATEILSRFDALSKLRKYLKADPNVEIINVHGRGYKLLVQDSAI